MCGCGGGWGDTAEKTVYFIFFVVVFNFGFFFDCGWGWGKAGRRERERGEERTYVSWTDDTVPVRHEDIIPVLEAIGARSVSDALLTLLEFL